MENKLQINILPNWSGYTVQHLCKNVLQIPKKLLHELRMASAVELNGEKVNWMSQVKTNDQLLFHLPKDENQTITPQNIPIQILYEDEHILIVNKPAQMNVHPNEQGQVHTLANAVAFYLQEKGDFRSIKHIHRLDQDTTGAVIFAKHIISEVLFHKQIENHLIERKYWALINGHLNKEEFIIHQSIGSDRHHPTRRRVSKSGQTAKTKITVVQANLKEKLTLVQCELFTGRTHQIRVHLQSIGCPIAGDVLYGGGNKFERQALHARFLSFIHPFTNEKIKITAPFIDKNPIFEQYIK